MQIRGYEQNQQSYQLNDASQDVQKSTPAQYGPDTNTKSTEQQNSSTKADQVNLSAEVLKLKTDEQRVIAHENAHKAAGGQYAGSAHYSYTAGPDGKQYIAGGEVSIDLSTGKTPEDTASKMAQVIRAALAPADPSGQDIAVAARASMIETRARMEYARSSESANQMNGTANSISISA
ncbi:MAG: hypothetical protein LLF86_05235 [Nitrospiraceae bacterium]|nr:hypothetical protein [Nitrospiraceae bacterium]